MFTDALAPAEIDIVRRSLKAAVEGSFFPDWEFQTLFGVDRETVRSVYSAWPRQTVAAEEIVLAVTGSLNHLLGYPHSKEAELVKYVPDGSVAIRAVLARLS